MQQTAHIPSGWIVSEAGPIEMMALSTLIVAGATFVVCSSWTRIGRFWHVPFGLFLLAEREADHGLPWVEAEVLTSTHWRAHPWDLNLIGNALLLMAALWAVWSLVRHGLPAFVEGWRDRAHWLTLLLAGSGVAILAQAAENLEDIHPLSLAAEESLELGFALCMLAAVIVTIRSQRAASRDGRNATRAGE